MLRVITTTLIVTCALPVLGAPCDPANTAPQPPAPLVATTEVQQVGNDAILTAGKIHVNDLLRYLQSATGKPVLFTSHPRYRPKALAPEAKIEILETIRPLTIPIAQAILAANYIQIRPVTLVDGTEVLHVTENRDSSLVGLVRPPESTPRTQRDAAAPLPVILDAKGDWPLAEDQTGNLVIRIEEAPIVELVRLVDKLVEDRRLEILPLGGKDAKYLLIKGKKDSLMTASQLIEALDRADLWPARMKDQKASGPPAEENARRAQGAPPPPEGDSSPQGS